MRNLALKLTFDDTKKLDDVEDDYPGEEDLFDLLIFFLFLIGQK